MFIFAQTGNPNLRTSTKKYYALMVRELQILRDIIDIDKELYVC